MAKNSLKRKVFMETQMVLDHYHIAKDGLEVVLKGLKDTGVYYGPPKQEVGKVISAKLIDNKVIITFQVTDKFFALMTKNNPVSVEIGFP